MNKYASHPVISRMRQPEELRSEKYLPWSHGRGIDVWNIICACIAGDLAAVQQLVARDPGLLYSEYAYLTPLYFAVRENHRPIVDFLLAQGVRISSGWDSYASLAKDRGYVELTHFFDQKLQEQFKIEPKGNIIAEAMRAFDQDRVKSLIENDPSLVFAADERGNLPIHWAVLTRQIPLIDYLLSRGADINAVRPDGARPLDLTNGDYFYRSWYRELPPSAPKHAEVLAHLLQKGAYYDISVAAKMGDLERVRTLLNEDPSLVKKLPAYASYYSGYVLRNAAIAGHYEMAALLLEMGADPNMPEGNFMAEGGALHSAIQHGHLDIAKLLLSHGANPNANVDSSGNCMYMAKRVGASQEFIDLLASYGGAETIELICYTGNIEMMAAILYASPNVKIDQHALNGAMGEGKKEILELILRYQPDILKDHPLHRAHSPELARWLMRNGLNPNTGNWLGSMPLHHAASDGDIEMAAVCLEFGADINVTDTDSCSTPLGWAAKANKPAMVAWLLQQGADPGLPADKSWARPLEWATRRGFAEVIELIKR